MQPCVELKNVAVRFHKLQVHYDISFKLYPGETVTLLGPSGTGKTIILKLIMGLLRPSAGQVWVLGKNLCEASQTELWELRTQLGMLFQGAALFDSLSVYDNVAYGLREHGQKDEARIAAIVNEKLTLVGLAGIESKTPPELSGGQKKRVGLARALATNPRIMLFDEPTTGLDPTARRLIDELIVKLREEFGICCLVVTHDIESAKRISNRWILINNGQVIADGAVGEVIRGSHDVQDFVEGNWQAEKTVSL